MSGGAITSSLASREGTPNPEDGDKHASRVGDYRKRVAQLSSKLCVLHDGLHHDSRQRWDHLHQKMQNLDERRAMVEEATAKKFTALAEHLAVFRKELEDQKDKRHHLVNAQQERITNLQATLRDGLTDEQKALQATEQRLVEVFKSKTDALKEEILSTAKTRDENASTVRHYLEIDLPKLTQGLQEEEINRQAMEERMLTKAMEEITHLQSAVLEEKRAREESEEAMLQMMQSIVLKMQEEIATEKEQREEVEDKLMGILHETCKNLEVASTKPEARAKLWEGAKGALEMGLSPRS